MADEARATDERPHDERVVIEGDEDHEGVGDDRVAAVVVHVFVVEGVRVVRLVHVLENFVPEARIHENNEREENQEVEDSPH